MDSPASASPPPLPKKDISFPQPFSEKSSNNSSTSSRRRKAREHTKDPPSPRELLRLLAREEEIGRDLEDRLYSVTDQLQYEQQRADEAERKLKETVLRFKDVNDARMLVQQDYGRVTEELKLYKAALEAAQKEIFRAQEVLNTVEDRRREAEEEALKFRNKARKLSEEKMINMAREEGRKEGIQAGLAMGKDIGYVRGRSKGYARGRNIADRVTEAYFSPQQESELPMTEDTGDFPRERTRRRRSPTVTYVGQTTTADSGPSSSSSEDIRPTPTRNTMYSPHHPHVDIPPDGWIPEADASLLIRIPPPHELARPPPTPGAQTPISLSRSPSPPLPALPREADPVLMIPEPRSPATPTYDTPDGTRRPPRVRRRSSQESVSTRTSDLELLSAPEGHRSSGLSVIPEVVSNQSTPNGGHLQPIMENHSDESGFVHVSMPAPRSPSDISRLNEGVMDDRYLSPQSRSRANDHSGSSRRTSTSSYSTVNITIQPPSRPASNNSQATMSGTRSHLLSPADADRPIPLPGDRPSPQATPSMVPLPPTGSTVPMSLPDGQFPLGFVPTGPPTPMSQSHGGETSRYSAAAVPLPPSTIGSHHHRLPSNLSYTGSTHTMGLPGGYGHAEREPVVIPPPSKMKYADSEDESVSSGFSEANTLTTPPKRYRVPSPSSTARYTAAGVPLPPSTAAGTPKTSFSYARTPEDRQLYVNAGVTPAALSRSMSFSTDRNGSTRG
ncbi:hypothetical protein BJ138DRAFT_1125350 [Hygrophoropsis aurantiaca]|uniref:Uncharacterized protein n=1 Tax=Hygrophoropsis aurantiaca TaxID=72124 RepID=A0ACB8AG34_9AGAM|nr:hypothetical protein BJ138DRAFT_1125350 [Hygrophoropsis aurantiaca]